MSKIVLPEKLSCITVDSRGNFCVGGTMNGRLYLWEVSVFACSTQSRKGFDLDLLGIFRLHREYSSIHLKAIIVVYRLYSLLRMVPVLSPPAMTLASMSGPCQGH